MYFNGNIIKLKKITNVEKAANWIFTAPKTYWKEYTFRQRKYSVHSNTESIFILYTENNIHEYKNDFFEKNQAFVNELNNKVSSKVKSNIKLTRLLAVKLMPNSYIKMHKDSGYHLENNWRCHVPIQTNNSIKFKVDTEELHFKEGHGYIINNQKLHGVDNPSPHERIHLICDFLNV